MNNVFKAISAETRRKIIEILSNGAMNQTELVSYFDISRQAVAKHLTVLKSFGIVDIERKGKISIYKLQIDKLESALIWLKKCISDGTIKNKRWHN